MTVEIDARSYPKMIFGENINLSIIEGHIYGAELLICDMTGTTIEDEGLALEAFRSTATQMKLQLGSAQFNEAINYAQQTMGYSKIEVFRNIFKTEKEAQTAHRAFETHYAKLTDECGIREIEGASTLFRTLRSKSIKVALTTGFSKTIQDLLIQELGWSDQVDYCGCPGENEPGRPSTNVISQAIEILNVANTCNVIVIGDTSSDITAAQAAKVGLTIGVLSGAHGLDELLSAKADLVLDSVSDLVTLFYAFGKPEK